MPASRDAQYPVTAALVQLDGSTSEERRAQVASATEAILSRLPRAPR
jgi:hypothetical protein